MLPRYSEHMGNPVRFVVYWISQEPLDENKMMQYRHVREGVYYYPLNNQMAV